MKKLIASIVVSIVMLGSAALASGSQWENLNQIIKDTGTVSETQFGIYLTLSSIVPIGTEGARQADYLSAVGGYDENGNFHAGHLEGVSEQWLIDADGNWSIDQWLFRVSVDGEIDWIAHYHMVQKPNGTMISHDSLIVDDGEGESKWHFWVEDWYARVGVK
ncbi:hypothetical protein [Bdellovibrio bacteriovorus]|uniref:hypothetical protein n=1 Tax=Bdellovibrio bacteriovorus TaxID=959 RepID=UPI003AA86888